MPSLDPSAGLVRRLVALGRIPVLAGVPPDALTTLVKTAEEAPVRRGERLGTRPGMLWFFPEGATSATGPTTGVTSTHAPELIPWLAGEPQPTEVVALEDGVAIGVATTALSAAIRKEFGVFLALAASLARKVIDAEQEPSVARAMFASMEQPLRPPEARIDLTARVHYLRAAAPSVREHVACLFQLARQTAELRADDAVELWRRGDVADHAMLVLQGTVRARTPGAVDLRAGPGAVLGAFDALAQRPRWFTAVAEGPIVALDLPIESLLDVLEDEPILARATLTALAGSLLHAWRECARERPSR